MQARTADGSLPRGSIIDDVVDISAATLQGLREKPQMLTAGFPCQDICQAGQQRGLEGSRSGLFSKSFASLMNALPCVWFSWRTLMPFVHWSRCGVLCWMHSWTAVLVRVGYLYRPLQLVALRSGSAVFSSQTRRVCTCPFCRQLASAFSGWTWCLHRPSQSALPRAAQRS